MTPIFARSDLAAHGLTPTRLRRLLDAGDVHRLRRGWYATADVSPEIRRAVAVGGVLTCVSLLARLGVWTMPHPDLHVKVASGTDVRPTGGVRLHWTHARIGREHGVDDLEAALVEAVTCLDLRAAVVVTDSALNRGLVSRSALDRLLALSPRGRRVLALADGCAESGIETLARLGLRRLRLRVRSQVSIPTIGRVDLLIGDRLVLELDGRQWHGDFEADRSRDRRLLARGYLVVRASYRQVMEEWDEIAAQILVLVRRDEHEWRTTLPQGARRGPARLE